MDRFHQHRLLYQPINFVIRIANNKILKFVLICNLFIVREKIYRIDNKLEIFKYKYIKYKYILSIFTNIYLLINLLLRN